MHNEPFRELTAGEAEAVAAELEGQSFPPMSDGEIERILRYVFVIDGRYPIEDLSPVEVEQVFAHKVREA